MTHKQRLHAALEGRPVDRTPVTVPYNMLYHQDHFAELTGRPGWELHKWQNASPEEHLRVFDGIFRQAPFSVMQPQWAPARQDRERAEFIEREGRIWRLNRDTGDTVELTAAVSGHASDYKDHETRNLFTLDDIRSLHIKPAEQRLAEGCNDYLDAMVSRYGADHFIVGGGVIGTVYSCSWHVGLTNVFELMATEPDFIDELCRRKLDENIEAIRAIAAAGSDAIYIDDATATSDMISVPYYERFSLPYMQEMVREIHRLGHKAILIYFGGVMDRLDQIASIGADGFSFEASMKGFDNDIAEIARRIGDKITLFGNVDPIGTLQDAADPALESELRRQAAGGRAARGFVMSTGSPITPSTPLSRVQRFLELGARPS